MDKTVNIGLTLSQILLSVFLSKEIQFETIFAHRIFPIHQTLVRKLTPKDENGFDFYLDFSIITVFLSVFCATRSLD